jgi:hypothetical protein
LPRTEAAGLAGGDCVTGTGGAGRFFDLVSKCATQRPASNAIL